ncbi:MAG: peptide chain release factor 2 [Candidatus Gracilibacteria bacterium]
MERYELEQAVTDLETQIIQACTKIDMSVLEDQVREYEDAMNAPDFWGKQEYAQEIIQKLKVAKSSLDTWKGLQSSIVSLKEMLSQSSEDEISMLEEEYKSILAQYEKSSFLLYFSGPYDKESILFSIISGVGGDDAEDFAGMLLRMYKLYFDKNEYTYEIFDISEGAGANGIKKVTLEVHGQFPYGMLKGEKGVHRLVRLSPFKSADSRQTSFALVDVMPLIKNISKDDIEIDEKDLRIDTFRSSGAGGQKVNKTDSAIRITHIPTGISVSCQVERSQHQNKDRAMMALRARLFQLQQEEQAREKQGIKGEVTSVDWGKQIRSYVLHPYKMVKDHRTGVEVAQVDNVLNGDLDEFIQAEIRGLEA